MTGPSLASKAPAPDISPGTLLGGRVHYAQAARGHRSGLEPVLLAAATPATPGALVLEAGSGAGAALLCLAARVRTVAGLGIERDPALVTLAHDNAAANGFTGLRFESGDIEGLRIGAHGIEVPFDHAIANPPWHDILATSGPDTAREAARRGRPGLIAAWVAALAASLRPRGTLTLIVATGVVPEAMAAMDLAGVGSIRLIPLWPRENVPAKLTLVQGVRGGKARMVLAAGLVLHQASGSFTPAAEAVLREGAALA